MPNDNVLTAEARATIMDACASISRSADALKECHTVDGDWGDDVDAKAFYDAELRLLKRLTALLAHTGQPVADDAAVRGDERAKRKAFTAVFLDVTTDEASEIVNHPKWSAGSWSHALDDRDAARAELARATSSQAHPGQPEPRTEVTDDDKVCAERYRWLRARMAFVEGHNAPASMTMRSSIPAPNHDFNAGFVGDHFDARVDAAIDAAIAAARAQGGDHDQ